MLSRTARIWSAGDHLSFRISVSVRRQKTEDRRGRQKTEEEEEDDEEETNLETVLNSNHE
jgi:hypothetical protein